MEGGDRRASGEKGTRGVQAGRLGCGLIARGVEGRAGGQTLSELVTPSSVGTNTHVRIRLCPASCPADASSGMAGLSVKDGAGGSTTPAKPSGAFGRIMGGLDKVGAACGHLLGRRISVALIVPQRR